MYSLVVLNKEIERLSKSQKKADKYKLEILKTKKENLLKKMNEENGLNEFQVEIVGRKVPANKVFDLKGKVIPLEQLKGSQSLAVIRDIKAALQKTGLLKLFNVDDISSMDIKPYKKDLYVLTSEAGPKYHYNVTTKKIFKAR